MLVQGGLTGISTSVVSVASSIAGADIAPQSMSLTGLVGTAGSGTGITANESGKVIHCMNKVTLTFEAFQTGALFKDVTAWTLPAKTRVLRVIADVTTPFTGGTVATATLRVGKAANGAGYLLDADAFTGAITAGDVAAEIGANLLSATVADITWSGTQIVNARLTTTVGLTSALTAGSVTFYIECAVYP